MITLRPRCTERVRIFHKAFPILRIILLRLVRRQAVPNPRVDLQHLRFLDDLDLRRERRWDLRFCVLGDRRVEVERGGVAVFAWDEDVGEVRGLVGAVLGGDERPGGVVCAPAGRGPDLVDVIRRVSFNPWRWRVGGK
jgi:hypothetical protein